MSAAVWRQAGPIKFACTWHISAIGRKKPELGQESQCLHATTLCFCHPRTGLPVIVTAPLPPYFQKVLDRLKETDG